MHYKRCVRVLAGAAALPALFFSASVLAAPTVYFTAPASGGTLSGNVQGPPNCVVQGTNIARVMFYLNDVWTNTDGNLSNGLGCWIDTTKYKDGTYTVKAVAYDSSGATATATRSITIRNSTTSSTSGPTVAFTAPAEGGALSGNVQGPPNCVVQGTNIARVMFYLNDVWTNTDGNLDNGLGCWIDTTKYKDGAYTVKAVAYDSAGRTATATRSIQIRNSTTTSDPTVPTVAFTAPAPGGALSGNVQGPPHCVVTGSNIARVMFYLNDVWTNTDGNLSNGLGCWIDTTKYKDGSYTVKAVAYSAAGKTASATRSIVIKNSTTTNTPPTVSITSPAAGATLSGTASCAASASDSGGSIAKVDFVVDGKVIGTDTGSPYTCSINTTALANGSHTLTAIATDNTGLRSTVQRGFNVQNAVSQPDTSSGGSIDPADILGQAQASVPFASHTGYNTQVINTYLSANQIPETGINGTVLSNGERLRLGKQVDPRDSSRKALAFQVAPSDPLTSGSHRAEIKFGKSISYNKVYWVAFSHYVYDWGTLPSGDMSMIAMQLHAGKSGLSPAIQLKSATGGRNFWIDARGSTSSSPSQSNSVSVRSKEMPIAFGRWMDVVIKFKLNASGNGFVQAWVDGQQVFDHKGTVGYNTGSTLPYFKFGYYNWTSFKTARKVLVRSPVFVSDPTGSKYSPDTLRNFVRSK